MDENRVIRVSEDSINRLGHSKPKIDAFSSEICELLLGSGDKDCVIFPGNTPGLVRKYCHEAAERRQLRHFSVEKGGEKRLIVTKVLDPNKLYNPNEPEVELGEIGRDNIRLKVRWTYDLQAPVYRLILQVGKCPLSVTTIPGEIRGTKTGATFMDAVGEVRYTEKSIQVGCEVGEGVRVVVDTDPAVTKTEWEVRGVQAGEMYGIQVEVEHDSAASDPVTMDIHTLSPILGRLYCWGNNSQGAFGHVTTELLLNQPTPLPAPLSDIQMTDLDAGYYHSAGISDRGRIVTWGRLIWTTDDTDPTPQAIASAPLLLSPSVPIQFHRLSCGDTHNLAVSTDGRLFSWGLGNVGELGLGGKTFAMQPEVIERVDDDVVQMPFFVDVACSQLVSLARTKEGAVYEWGFVTLPASPMLPTTLSLPKYVKSILGGSICTSISAGSGYKAAVLRNKELYMWGQNMAGVLGNGSTETLSFPVRVVLPPVLQVSCGTTHVGVITMEREVYAWGRGDKGQLGTGDYSHSLTPRKVPMEGLQPPVQIACNGNCTLLLLTSGELYACGEGKNACLGIGISGKAKSPMKVKVDLPVSKVKLGLQHSLASLLRL